MAEPTITAEAFGRLDLRMGKVVGVERVTDHEDLSVVSVEAGEELRCLAPSSQVSDDLVGKRVVVAAKLYPLSVAGVGYTAALLHATKQVPSSVVTIESAAPDGSSLY